MMFEYHLQWLSFPVRIIGLPELNLKRLLDVYIGQLWDVFNFMSSERCNRVPHRTSTKRQKQTYTNNLSRTSTESPNRKKFSRPYALGHVSFWSATALGPAVTLHKCQTISKSTKYVYTCWVYLYVCSYIWSILMKSTKKLDISDRAFFLAPRGLAGFLFDLHGLQHSLSLIWQEYCVVPFF